MPISRVFASISSCFHQCCVGKNSAATKLGQSQVYQYDWPGTPSFQMILGGGPGIAADIFSFLDVRSLGVIELVSSQTRQHTSSVWVARAKGLGGPRLSCKANVVTMMEIQQLLQNLRYSSDVCVDFAVCETFANPGHFHYFVSLHFRNYTYNEWVEDVENMTEEDREGTQSALIAKLRIDCPAIATEIRLLDERDEVRDVSVQHVCVFAVHVGDHFARNPRIVYSGGVDDWDNDEAFPGIVLATQEVEALARQIPLGPSGRLGSINGEVRVSDSASYIYLFHSGNLPIPYEEGDLHDRIDNYIWDNIK